MNKITDKQRIDRLENVVGILIELVYSTGLTENDAEELLLMLNRNPKAHGSYINITRDR